jgi:hypothetical protein
VFSSAANQEQLYKFGIQVRNILNYCNKNKACGVLNEEGDKLLQMATSRLVSVTVQNSG